MYADDRWKLSKKLKLCARVVNDIGKVGEVVESKYKQRLQDVISAEREQFAELFEKSGNGSGPGVGAGGAGSSGGHSQNLFLDDLNGEAQVIRNSLKSLKGHYNQSVDVVANLVVDMVSLRDPATPDAPDLLGGLFQGDWVLAREGETADSDKDDERKPPTAVKGEAAQPALYRTVVVLSQVFGLLGDAFAPDGRPAGRGKQWLRTEAFEIMVLRVLLKVLSAYLSRLLSAEVLPVSAQPASGFMGFMKKKRVGWTAADPRAVQLHRDFRVLNGLFAQYVHYGKRKYVMQLFRSILRLAWGPAEEVDDRLQ